MKKFLSLLLAAIMLCTAAAALAETTEFLWDNFDGNDRSPAGHPDLAPNGQNIWWDNWDNLRAKNEDGVLKLDYRPLAYDPEDDLYESEDEFYASRGWLGNFGEAINMWALEDISWCKYLTIRIKGEEGGEENKLIMTWHPEDSKFYSARFSDLVTADGSHPAITTEWQDIVIDLEASGFPGMTNAFHIYAIGKCIIYLDEIKFSEPVAPVNVADPVSEITAEETGWPEALPLKDYVAELGE